MKGFELMDMRFTPREIDLAQKLKQSGIAWNPEEGDWFWSKENIAHNFYLGESLPASYSFQKGEIYVFDSGMTWHVQQGGLNLDRFVWLPTWEQCRSLLRERGGVLAFKEGDGGVVLEANLSGHTLSVQAETDREGMYEILLKASRRG